MSEQRIKLDMTAEEAIVAMSEGHAGATRVLIEICCFGAQIDPASALGSLGSILKLDALGIYGPRIWALYALVCQEDLMKLVAVLRAHQLGLCVTRDDFDHAINNDGQGIDIDAVVAAVKKVLPDFDTNFLPPLGFLT